jgi:nicotinate-nucleotide pyrophosphorylase (carboxylating)
MTCKKPSYNPRDADQIIKNALREDIGKGDITTASIIPAQHLSSAVLTAKEGFIIAGLPFAERTFYLVDRGVTFKALKREGSRVKKGEMIASVRGRTKSILMAERVMLNIVQRMSGIATLTDNFVRCVQGLKARIVDTRKTAPGLRFLDKYAVRAGGGENHRFGLYDAILIKDNHIEAAGGISRAVTLARTKSGKGYRVEVETGTLAEVRAALLSGADIIMLDNMPLERMRKALKLIRKESDAVIVEASGNVSLQNVRAIAKTGVDMISVGALTHSVRAADISLRIVSL